MDPTPTTRKDVVPSVSVAALLGPGGTGSDPTSMAAVLMRDHPGTLVWFGAHTRHWWALVPLRGDWFLLEAINIAALALALIDDSPEVGITNG